MRYIKKKQHFILSVHIVNHVLWEAMLCLGGLLPDFLDVARGGYCRSDPS